MGARRHEGIASIESSRAPRDHHMRGLLTRHVMGARVPERRQVEARQEMFSGTEEHWSDGQVHLVDEARVQVLPPIPSRPATRSARLPKSILAARAPT